MSWRDLDLILGTILVAAATMLARLHDPALAIVALALALSVVILWLGDERLEALWREYTREAPPSSPRRRKPVPPIVRGAWKPSRLSRTPRLAPARVILRGERAGLRAE